MLNLRDLLSNKLNTADILGFFLLKVEEQYEFRFASITVYYEIRGLTSKTFKITYSKKIWEVVIWSHRYTKYFPISILVTKLYSVCGNVSSSLKLSHRVEEALLSNASNCATTLSEHISSQQIRGRFNISSKSSHSTA